LSGQPTITLSYTNFLQQVQQGNVKDVTLTGNAVSGDFKTPLHEPQSGTSSTTTSARFTSYVPETGDPTLLPLLEKNGVQVTAQPVQIPWWQTALTILLNALPLLLLVYIGYMAMRSIQQSQQAGGIFGIGRSRAKLYTEERPSTTFADVAGVDEAKADLREEIDFLREPQRYLAIGAHIPKGVLLVGPPGTGKTLLARAVAGEASVPFFSASGTDFVELFVGLGASRVRDLFEQGKKNAPCIIFIDEIDAVGRHRGAGLGGGHDEREQTLNQLLVEMDGFESNEGVILMAATNRPDVLDPALLRPGRFDRRVVVSRPDVRGREEILRVHTRKIPLAEDVDLSVLARGTPGFSGADLANMVNEAALAAARQNRKAVLMYDFEVAKDKVLMGVERKSMILSDEEKKVTAFHEAGHALVAAKLPNSDPVHKVTIIPRGMALGVTQQLPIDDRHNYTKEYLQTDIAILMGGRLAEEIFLTQMSTGAGNDIERATELARKMVCEWGMSDLGPLTFGKKEEQIFLGREIAQHRDYSEDTAIKIDGEVRKLVSQGYETAKAILEHNREALQRIASALLEREVLDASEIRLLIDGKDLPAKTPSPGKSDDGVQQVLKPEPGRPAIVKGGESPARA
jgi:cell division protease FtsH